MKQFSIILPSRDRPDLLYNLLTSVKTKTKNIKNIDVWVALDEDAMYEIDEFMEQFPFLRIHAMPRQNGTVGYYNRLAHISRGNYLWSLNDDCEIITQDWDIKALEQLEEQKKIWTDGVFLAKMKDGLGTGYCCFPMITREAYKVVGWWGHPETTAWGQDILLDKIYGELGRTMFLKDIEVMHYTHHNNSRNRDDLNRRIGTISHYNWGCAPGEANRIRNILISLNGNPPA